MDRVPAPETTPSTGRTWLLLAAILIAALGVRLISLRHEAVWYDEVMILQNLDSPNVVQFLRDALPRTPVPPGFMITEYLWAQVVGTDSVVALRVWPLICGIAGLAMLFVLTRQLFGDRTALLTTVWVSFLYWHIHYSQEIRYYPLALLLSLLSMWAFVNLCAAPGYGWLGLQVAFNAAMVWTHPISVFLCAAQFLFLLVFRRTHLKIIGYWTALHLILGLTLYAFLQSLDQDAAYAQAAWISKPTLWGPAPSFRNLFSMFSGVITLTPTNGVGDSLYAIEPYTAVALIVLHVAGAICGALSLRRSDSTSAPGALTRRETAALLLFWLVIPPVLVFIVSHVWKPMFIVRYVLFAAPPLYMLLSQTLLRMPRAAIAAAFALLLAHDALFYFPGPMRMPFDQLAQTIESGSSRKPVIYLDDMLGMPAIEYYWKGETPEFPNPLKRDDVLDPQKRPKDRDIWVVFTNEQRAGKYAQTLKNASLASKMIYLGAGKPFWVYHLSE